MQAPGTTKLADEAGDLQSHAPAKSMKMREEAKADRQRSEAPWHFHTEHEAERSRIDKHAKLSATGRRAHTSVTQKKSGDGGKSECVPAAGRERDTAKFRRTQTNGKRACERAPTEFAERDANIPQNAAMAGICGQRTRRYCGQVAQDATTQ